MVSGLEQEIDAMALFVGNDALLDWNSDAEYRRAYEKLKERWRRALLDGRPLPRAELARLASCFQTIENDLAGRQLFTMFPDDGPCARRLYPRHMEFMSVGRRYRERCFMAANRVGKTTTGAFEVTLHLTGLYPPWWEGRVFSHPVEVTVAGKTNEQTRDIIQKKLFGDPATTPKGRRVFRGNGLVPAACILEPTWKSGIADMADVVPVRHKSGGTSHCHFRSYQQGRGSFEGTSRHVIWLDEEPPLEVYDECLMRTADCDGIILMTFTPLEGVSDVVRQFLPDGGLSDGAGARSDR
jgi:phage terminase large subunit-like protein